MIWGETFDRRREREWSWQPHYALLPVQLMDGRWAWLERLEVKRATMEERMTRFGVERLYRVKEMV